MVDRQKLTALGERRNHRMESAIVNNRYESSASYPLVPHVNYRWKTEQNNME